MTVPEAAERFSYVARDAEGRRVTGGVGAPDETAARAELRRRGLHPVSLTSARRGGTAATGRGHAARPLAGGSSGEARRPLRAADEAALIEALARLVERRIAPDRALLICRESRTARIGATAEAVRVQVRAGRSLPDALVEAGALSDPAARALLQAGEASGDLAGALATAARILNGRLAAARRLATGLLYPAILLVVSLASVGLVLAVIIPEFRPLVAERMDLVPPLGRLVFAVSDGLLALWPLLLAGLAIAGLAAASLARRRRLRPAALRIARRLPGVGGVIGDVGAMLTLRILGALTDKRVPLARALGILTANPPDPERAEALAAATRRVERGEPLSEAAEAEGLLPPAAVEMLRIGEETGTLPAMLLRAADDLEEASERRMLRVITLMEPALIVGVGCVIGISLYALFTAITAVNTLAF